ncbi:hypothetical protein NKG05_24175 [Oerskovia sp. M15]
MVRHVPPALEDAVILPRPFDKPGRGEHLDIAIATGGNPQSSVRAASSGSRSTTRSSAASRRSSPLVDLYRRAATQSGHDAAGLEVSVSTIGFVADDGKHARDFFYPTTSRT